MMEEDTKIPWATKEEYRQSDGWRVSLGPAFRDGSGKRMLAEMAALQAGATEPWPEDLETAESPQQPDTPPQGHPAAGKRK